MADNLQSTLVAWLKVALPLVALAILSTLFLVARTIDPADAIPFAQVDIEDRIREPRLTGPTWAGVTDDGSALTVSADEARPGVGGGATAQAVSASLDMPGGTQARLTAQAGQLDNAGRQFVATGDVVITISTGYRIESDRLIAALDRTGLQSPGPVTASGPVGRIDAGAMDLHQDEASPGTYVLVFKDGVKLLYDPRE